MLKSVLRDIYHAMAAQAAPASGAPASLIRLATPGHLEFLFAAHLEAAGAGHFTSDYLHPHTHAGLRRQLASSVHRQQCAGSSGPLASRIYVHEDGGTATGFCWVRQVAGSAMPQQEIYAVFVHPQHRGKGIASTLVRHVFGQFPASTGFLARLFPASRVMDKVLRRLGFEGHSQTLGQTISLQRPPTGWVGIPGVPGLGTVLANGWLRNAAIQPRQP